MTRKILAELKAGGNGRDKRILLLLDGDRRELTKLCDPLGNLKRQGYSLIAVTAAGFKEKAASCFEFDETYIDPEPDQYGELLAAAEAVAVPVLTLATAARVSLGLAETAPEKMLAACIAGGKKTLLAIDACIPEQPAFAVDTAYAAMIIRYLRTLVEFGCHITSSRLFMQTLLGMLTADGGAKPDREIIIEKQLITETDIEGRPAHSRIIIGPQSCLTEAAHNLVVRNGIMLLRRLG